MSDKKSSQSEATVELTDMEIQDGINWYNANPFRIQKPDPAYRYYDAALAEGHPCCVVAMKQIGYELDPDPENACMAPGHVRMRIPVAMKRKREAFEAYRNRMATENVMSAPAYAEDAQAGRPQAITFDGHGRKDGLRTR